MCGRESPGICPTHPTQVRAVKVRTAGGAAGRPSGLDPERPKSHACGLHAWGRAGSDPKSVTGQQELRTLPRASGPSVSGSMGKRSRAQNPRQDSSQTEGLPPTHLLMGPLQM